MFYKIKAKKLKTDKRFDKILRMSPLLTHLCFIVNPSNNLSVVFFLLLLYTVLASPGISLKNEKKKNHCMLENT